MMKETFMKNIGEEYIKEFKISNGKITVYNYKEIFRRKKYKLDYSEENIQKLLEKQEAQIKDYDELRKIYLRRNIILSLTSYSIYFTYLNFLIANNISLLNVISKVTLIGLFFTNQYIKHNYNNMISDFEKKEMFLKYKDNINTLLKDNEIILNKNGTKIIDKGTNLNINDISKLKIQSLKMILAKVHVKNIEEILKTKDLNSKNDQGNQKKLK